MKKLLMIGAVLLSLAALADRTDVWSTASIRVTEVHLSKLPDGGCSVSATGTYTKADGGTLTEATDHFEVAGANRTDCLNILDVRALALFKLDKGL